MSRPSVIRLAASGLLGAAVVAAALVVSLRHPPASPLPSGRAPGPVLSAGHRVLSSADIQLRQQAAELEWSYPPGIVRAAGTHLVLDGQPWRFVGFDDYRLTSLSAPGAYTCGGTQSDATVAADFAEMHALGVTVVRTWFFQSYWAAAGFAPFDRVLSDAAAFGIKVIPVLGNEWPQCEGPAGAYKDLAWYSGGYRDVSSGKRLSYRAYAVQVAEHYAADPAIAFWQLMNEAEARGSEAGACDEPLAAQALRDFADDMASALKAVDPAHLVSLGTIGGTQCGTDGADYRYVNAGSIDLCEQHDYGPVLTRLLSNPCAALDKPLFIGERGITATGTPVSLQARAAAFTTDVARAFAGDGCQGYLIWSWSSGASEGYDVTWGDPTDTVVLEASRNEATGEEVYLALSRAPSSP